MSGAPAGVPARIAVRSRLRMWTILLTSGLAFLAPSAVAPGLPALQSDFAHLENAELLSRMVLTMPLLFIALSGSLVGYAVDRFGRRNVLIVSATFYGLSGISVLVLDSLLAILVSRAILGVFLAGILTSVTALVGDYYTGDERNRVAGLQGAFMSFGTLIFVVISGLLAEIHWRVSFSLFAVTFALVPLMILSLYEPPSAASGGARREPPPTLRQWAVIGFVCVLTFVTMIALFMIPSQTQFLLVEIGVKDPTRAGLAIGMFNFSAGFASLSFRRVRRALSPEAIFAAIFTIGGAGLYRDHDRYGSRRLLGRDVHSQRQHVYHLARLHGRARPGSGCDDDTVLPRPVLFTALQRTDREPDECRLHLRGDGVLDAGDCNQFRGLCPCEGLARAAVGISPVRPARPSPTAPKDRHRFC
ncbi:MAG: MFS transporter [Alphaproteobacteria bacterium]